VRSEWRGGGAVPPPRAPLRQPLDDLSARRIRERCEGAVEVENRAHIFNLKVDYSSRPLLVKRSKVTPTPRKAVQWERHEGVFTMTLAHGTDRLESARLVLRRIAP